MPRPVAATTDELGDAWRDARLHLPLVVEVNGGPFGRPNAGVDMTFDFGQLIAHAATTRRLGAGSIVGSGTVSNRDRLVDVEGRIPPDTREALAALAYDVGANVLAAECFFRGALFNRAQRRWSFAAAAALASGLIIAWPLKTGLLAAALCGIAAGLLLERRQR